MPEKIDPRQFGVIDTMLQVNDRLKPQPENSEEIYREKILARQKTNAKKVRKDWLTRQVHQEMTTSPKAVPGEIFEEEGVLRQGHSQTNYHNGTLNEPIPNQPPSITNTKKAPDKGLPSLFDCAERLKEKANLVSFQKKPILF